MKFTGRIKDIGRTLSGALTITLESQGGGQRGSRGTGTVGQAGRGDQEASGAAEPGRKCLLLETGVGAGGGTAGEQALFT